MDSSTVLSQLRMDWPKRIALTPEEVALVLGRDPDSRGVLQKIRAKMKAGIYPNARKIDGRWLLPLEDLAEILAPASQRPAMAPVAARVMGGSGKRMRSSIGPRIAFVQQVHAAMGLDSEFQEVIGRLPSYHRRTLKKKASRKRREAHRIARATQRLQRQEERRLQLLESAIAREILTKGVAKERSFARL